MSDDGTPNRRRLLETLGGSAVALVLAGCSGDGGSTTDDGGPSDEGDATTTTGTTTAGDDETDETTATEGSDGVGGGSVSVEGVHTVGSDDQHDWKAITKQQEVGSFSAPDPAPTSWGYKRVGNEFTVRAPSFASGTAYVMFVGSERVEVVLVVEPAYGGGELVVGPDDSAYPMDADPIEGFAVAWESEEGEVYLVKKFGYEWDDSGALLGGRRG